MYIWFVYSCKCFNYFSHLYHYYNDCRIHGNIYNLVMLSLKKLKTNVWVIAYYVMSLFHKLINCALPLVYINCIRTFWPFCLMPWINAISKAIRQKRHCVMWIVDSENRIKNPCLLLLSDKLFRMEDKEKALYKYNTYV